MVQGCCSMTCPGHEMSQNAAGRSKGCLQLSDDRNERWVDVLGGKPSLTPRACCSSPHSPPLSGCAQVPSFCLFLHPREQWKNQSPVLGRRDAFLSSESQTISTTGPGIFTGGHILERKKRVSCQLGEWGGEAFLFSSEKLGSHMQAGYFGSSVRECPQTGPCPKDITQQ